MDDGEICLKAGNDCAYTPDGGLKQNYMDFEAKGAYCRAGQITRCELDSKNRKRVCCEPKKGAVPEVDLSNVDLCATNCAGPDNAPEAWSLMMCSGDLKCKPGFIIKTFPTDNGEKCCCFDEKKTTTTTEATTTSSEIF